MGEQQQGKAEAPEAVLGGQEPALSSALSHVPYHLRRFFFWSLRI